MSKDKLIEELLELTDEQIDYIISKLIEQSTEPTL